MACTRIPDRRVMNSSAIGLLGLSLLLFILLSSGLASFFLEDVSVHEQQTSAVAAAAFQRSIPNDSHESATSTAPSALSRCAGNEQEATANPALPWYVIPIGLEGSGHNWMAAVYQELEREMDSHITVLDYAPTLHFSSQSPGVGSTNDTDFAAEFKRNLQNAMRMKRRDLVGVIVDPLESFPMGPTRTAVSHPDIPAILQLDGVLFNVAVIVLHRDPVDCVHSIVRRLHGRLSKADVMQDHLHNLLYIESVLPMLPCCRTVYLNFEKAHKELRRVARGLSQIVENAIPTEKLFASLANTTKPGSAELHKSQYRETHAASYQNVADFFETRRAMWPTLYSLSESVASMCGRNRV